MKYWKINSLCHSLWGRYEKSRALEGFQHFFYRRDYDSVEAASEQLHLTSPDGKQYRLSLEWEDELKIMSVRVDQETEGRHRHRAPQAAYMVKDYIRINPHFWYYLECIEDKEDRWIKTYGRMVTPLQIKRRIEAWDDANLPPQPDVVSIGEYDYQQTDVYRGKKSTFPSLLDFWMSCLYWVDCGEWNTDGFVNLNYTHAYDLNAGSCIPWPLHEAEIEQWQREKMDQIVSYIQNALGPTTPPLRLYYMRKNPYDQCFVLEYDDQFVMYNWHTAE